MPNRKTLERLYQELLAKHGQAIADAFMAAVEDLRSAAEVQRLIAAIDAGNVEAAIAALHIDRAAYGPVMDALQIAYSEGGQNAAAGLPPKTPAGAALVVRFDARNVRAEQWLRSYSADLVTRIVDDQKTAVREALTAGMTRGENPRTTALDIVGRVDKATGKRVGGILGLSAPQQQYVRSARDELASADPADLRAYLNRQRRDKRFDRSIAKAIKTGTAVPKDIQAKAAVAYERKLLALRGETIGRTEAMTSLHAAQQEALRQAVDTGQVSANQIRRVWSATGDARTRDTHHALDGQSVGLEESFVSPSGARLRYPGDPSAPAADRCNCRCWLNIRVDWLSNLR